jgi:hypothetical protein
MVVGQADKLIKIKNFGWLSKKLHIKPEVNNERTAQ